MVGLIAEPRLVMNKCDVVSILREIVAIPSVNPALTGEPRWQGEARLADWLEEWFHQRGIRTQRVGATPGRPNLLVISGADGATKRILFESHLDTIGVEGFQGDPFDLRAENGRLYGRGACDTKGPLAAFLAVLDSEVLEALAEAGIQLLWLGAIGEETGNLGAEEAVAAGVRADKCIVLEPTGLGIIHAHKGACWFTAATTGRAAHASDPALGDNAILKMPAVWKILEEEVEEAAGHYAGHPLGRPTVSVGTIHGGTATNVVPDSCVIQVDRRLMPGETAEKVLADLNRRLAGIPGGVKISLLKEGLPFHTEATAPLVEQWKQALVAAGVNPVLGGAAWCSDAGVLAQVCRETIVWGPGAIAQAHTTDEYITEGELVLAAKVIRQFLRDVASQPLKFF